MGGLVAILDRTGGDVAEGDIRRMTEATRVQAADRRATWAEGSVGMGCVMFDTTPEAAHERLPLQAGPFVLVADARVDNRTDLAEALQARLLDLGLLSETRPVTDADLLLAAYAEWGTEAPTRIVGDFAFAVWDQERSSLFVARDPMGVRPLYVHDTPERVTIATEPHALFAGGVPRQVELAMLRTLVRDGDTMTADETPYAGVRLLPNAHAADIGLGQTREWRHHTLTPAAPPQGDRAVVAEFLRLFQDAVAARTRLGHGVGVQLSGGLDSSFVACVARDLLAARGHGPLPAFTLLFDETPETDEREYANVVLDSGGFEAVAVPADDLSPLGNLDEFYTLLSDGPATGTQHLVWAMYKAAGAAGLRVMLDGIDGDITVEHGEDRLYELARAGDWTEFFREAVLLQQAFGADPRTRFVDSVESDFAGGPRRLFSIFGLRALDDSASLDPPWEFARLLARAVRDGRAKPGVVLRRVWRRLMAPAVVARRLRPETLVPRPSLRERQLGKLTDPGLSRSMALMSHAAAAFGLEVSHPFFDVRLIEFCLGLPSEYSLRDGVTRRVLRLAMAGVVPREVVDRATKNTMTPAFHRALFETDREPLSQAAASLRAWPGGAPPEADDLEREVSRLARMHVQGGDVAGPDGALVAARASIAVWVRRLLG